MEFPTCDDAAPTGVALDVNLEEIVKELTGMTRIPRERIVSGAIALVVVAAGVPALAQAQDATPMASPAAGAPMEIPPPPEWAEVIATGLANPRGMVFGADGTLYISEAGIGGDGPCAMGPEGNEECFGHSGGVTRVADGVAERVVEGLASRAAAGGMNATGPNDISVAGDAIYVLIGFAGDPATRAEVDAGADELGHLFVADGNGVNPVVDVAGFETDNNPDAQAFDANPFSLQMFEDGSGLIVDAGMNALLSLGADGVLTTLAVFPNETANLPDGAEVPMNPVPTGLAVAADGSILVGELTGFPFPPGGADVMSVPAAGGEPVVAFDEFTNVIDVAVGPDGSVYVLEFNQGGMLSIDPANPATLDGQLTRIAPDGIRTVVASQGLTAPTGLVVDAEGVPYVAVFGVLGEMGQVWRIAPAT
jgi:hypothetical protein